MKPRGQALARSESRPEAKGRSRRFRMAGLTVTLGVLAVSLSGCGWQDVIGLYPPPAEVISHRMRMNTFLGKWLEYLAEQGHGVATLHPAGFVRDVA